MKENNIINLEARRDKTVIIGQGNTSTFYLSCAYKSALVMRVYENGDVESISLGGEAMDNLCKTWMEYQGREGKR